MAIILGDAYALPADRFTFSKRTMVCEASTLGYTAARGGIERMLHRIYDDACDVGIAIQGRTGLIRFYLASEDKDGEGDVSGFRFRPIPEDARRHPEAADLSVLIIND